MVRHFFPATKLLADTFPQILPKRPETLKYIYDPHWFPLNFINIPVIPSGTIQKLTTNHHKIEIKSNNAETQPFTCTDISENTNASLEASPIENLETIIHSQPDTRLNETTETDFNSTLLDDGKLFSSHAANILIHLESNDENNNHNNNNINITNNTTDNTHIYQNHQHRQPLNSTELTQNSDPLNTTLPPLPNVNTPLPRPHRQNAVHFNSEPIILHNSTQNTSATNQNFQITPQKLVNIVRQLNSQSTQQITNAPTPFHLHAKEDFLNAITANMVMTAGPEQTVSPYHEAWILKRITMIQTALIGPAQQWY